MARRGRVIGVVLGLVALFLFITSRNSGSHPRDLKSTLPKENQEPLRPIIKEPAGTWDPVKDGFKSGPAGQEKPEAVKKQAAPVEEVSRKTPKKAGQDTGKAADTANNAKGQPEPKKEIKKPGQGSGAVVPGKEEKEDQVVIDQYDPAEGTCCR